MINEKYNKLYLNYLKNNNLISVELFENNTIDFDNLILDAIRNDLYSFLTFIKKEKMKKILK